MGRGGEKVRKKGNNFLPLITHTYRHTYTHITHHTHTPLLGLTFSDTQKVKSTKDIKTS